MANIVAAVFMFICGFVFLQMHNFLVSRHNIRLVRNRMKQRNDVSNEAADDGETLRNLAIPQVDKSKVDKKVKQRLDDSIVDLFTALVERSERSNSSGTGAGGMGSNNYVSDPELREKLDHFQNCLTFNIATAQAKLVGNLPLFVQLVLHPPPL
jgi:hypothetical protein